ncbi:uridine diphosphate glucose pyrophosphatase NUDT14 isoform X2 [Latimeria chalumnae]|nr:PREDICTED: uridine diphosphate glucose pyrophosphatase [Latimeria chalumnae]|eukprot:XP_014340711.1 PREDICTED: uridine diphosphate glucose pyrophosphatase [Latimeria chalumnae]
MRTHDSVSVLIFNTTRQSFVMVKQFRPAVYMCEMEKHNSRDQDNDKDGKPSICNPVDLPPASVGITYELCAGIVDKPDLSLEEIAKQEILEECGYDVPVANLKKITSYRSGVGATGAKQTMFYAEVSDDMKVGAGGGQAEEGEFIEVVEVPLCNSVTFANDENIPKTMGVMFGFMWFQSNIAPVLLSKQNV